VVVVGNQKFVDNTIMVRQARQMGRSTLEAKLCTHAQETSNRATTAEFNDKKRKNDKNKENEMELIVTYGVEVLKFLEEISDNYAGMACCRDSQTNPHISTVKQNMLAGNHLFATNDITVLVCMSPISLYGCYTIPWRSTI
jgi:hypothetical protein